MLVHLICDATAAISDIDLHAFLDFWKRQIKARDRQVSKTLELKTLVSCAWINVRFWECSRLQKPRKTPRAQPSIFGASTTTCRFCWIRANHFSWFNPNDSPIIGQASRLRPFRENVGSALSFKVFFVIMGISWYDIVRSEEALVLIQTALYHPLYYKQVTSTLLLPLVTLLRLSLRTRRITVASAIDICSLTVHTLILQFHGGPTVHSGSTWSTSNILHIRRGPS